MRVLIADDHRDTAETLGKLIACEGYEPVIVCDGLDAAVHLHALDTPRLAVLDWKMPGMSGVDICRTIRKESARPYTYVILVTGKSEKEDLLNGLNAGADDYLVKPVDVDELFARLATGRRILDLQEQLLTTQRLLKEQATRDALTGLMNRRAVLEALDREWTRCDRECSTLTVVMADIDHFKAINDTHGHVIGDQVLHMTAQRLQSALRPYDSIGRYGGEEFLIVLTGCTADMSLRSAERVRHAVEATPFRTEAMINVTLSLGIADWDGHSSAQDLIRVADAALYQAKSQGRNRSVVADPGPITHTRSAHSPYADSN